LLKKAQCVKRLAEAVNEKDKAGKQFVAQPKKIAKKTAGFR
jgi:hypothetical protein